MRHQRLRRKLGVKTHHRKALLRNLVRHLVIFKRIQTTYAKAKEASAFADRMVTIAKDGDLSSRRLLISKLGCVDTAKTLMTQIAPHFKDRQGGYTRVLRLGNRNGDNAQMALLEFTALIEAPAKKSKPKKEKPTKEAKKEVEIEKPKKEKPAEKIREKHMDHPAGKAPSQEKESKETSKDKKETEKKGGFLGALRKFLKGDDK